MVDKAVSAESNGVLSFSTSSLSRGSEQREKAWGLYSPWLCGAEQVLCPIFSLYFCLAPICRFVTFSESVWEWVWRKCSSVHSELSGSMLVGFIGKAWLLITSRNNLAAPRASEHWAFSFWFRLRCHWMGEQECLNRNFEYLYCVYHLAWPTAFLSSPLHFTSEPRPLSFFYYTKEPLCCRHDFSNVTCFG